MREKIARTIQIFEAARQPLFTVLDGISRDDLDWQPGEGMRGVGKICRHVYRVDIWLMKRAGIAPVTEEEGPASAETIAGRMRRIQEQIIAEVNACADDAELIVERTSVDGKAKAALGPTVLHIAQHYLYHLAQITYLRRLRDRDWAAPLDMWEAATHLIEDYLLE